MNRQSKLKVKIPGRAAPTASDSSEPNSGISEVQCPLSGSVHSSSEHASSQDGGTTTPLEGATYVAGQYKLDAQGVNVNSTSVQRMVPIEELIVDRQDSGSILAEGASSAVYVARHIRTGEYFALKEINISVGDSGESERFQKLIERELATLSSTNSPNIIKFFGAFYRDGKVDMVLEYMDMGSLEHVLKNVGAVPERLVSVVARQALSGLHYLKMLRLVHRDIKPSNILINSRGEVKIADFGLSGKANKTHEGVKSFCGTVTYMAPERIRGEKHTASGDIWSFGLSMVHLAIGQFPYNVNVDTGFWDLLHKITQEAAPSLPPTCSPEFSDFVSHCLVKDPQRRASAELLLTHPFILMYQDATEAELAAWLRMKVPPPR